jgi:hypothetical protein
MSTSTKKQSKPTGGKTGDKTMKAVAPPPTPKLTSKAKVKRPQIYGRGDYVADAVDFFDKDNVSEGFVNKGARKLGEFVGDKFGFGREIGNAASKLAKIFGFGDYTVDQPRAVNHKFNLRSNSFAGASPPTFSNGKGEDIVMIRREYVKDITSSGLFKSQRFFLNPGNPELFPWLSQFARGYEEYQFLGMVFEFKSTCSSAISTGGGMGTVIMATDYDCMDTNYVDKRTMEASEYSNSAAPYVSYLHPIECDTSRNVLGKMYVLPGVSDISQITTTSGLVQDPRFASLGQSYIAVEGNADTGTVIGELWVSYKIKLSRPILEAGHANIDTLQTLSTVVNTDGSFVNQGGASAPFRSVVRGGTGFSVVSYGQGASPYVIIRFTGTSPGKFMLHCVGLLRTPGVTSTWTAGPSQLITNTGWSYDADLLPGTTPMGTDNRYMTGAYTTTTTPYGIPTGSLHNCYTMTHVGIFTPTSGGGAYNTITLQIPVNTSNQSSYNITIIGLPLLASTSRVRNELHKIVSANHTRDAVLDPPRDTDSKQDESSSSSDTGPTRDDSEEEDGSGIYLRSDSKWSAPYGGATPTRMVQVNKKQAVAIQREINTNVENNRARASNNTDPPAQSRSSNTHHPGTDTPEEITTDTYRREYAEWMKNNAKNKQVLAITQGTDTQKSPEA